MRLTLVQNNPGSDLAANMSVLRELVLRAADQRPDLIGLPEYYAFMGDRSQDHQAAGERFDELNGWMSGLARETGIAIHAGSLAERRDGKTYNTTVVHASDGSELARYSKIHLVDIDLPDGSGVRESAIIARGTTPVVYQVAGWTVGCSICYDMRFPELYRKLRDMGAELLMVPSAFMRETGRMHWDPILRTRAIETGCYLGAPGQVHEAAGGQIKLYGNSLICDPWGQVTARASDIECIVTADLDRAYMEDIRMHLPVHRHHVL
ncbi:carbon-nitrogen hydrolase family protein [Pseudodonghicola flavimaris]|uniref:Carbon-nitrogen hydrolase family protein n=1 Tax=Pseudodonghicola flavimaris TaxID=3050036 RepID=A0ABT7F3Z0_9RHOB|nr:carbon-nitrogen hydrolase family protein [Pseudodonghicola flavimaris]MDK3019205.1 carbon-nitrogen hydrolase family protein [Pseudodonghicola flavimaris]